jgi:chromosome segregation ATPase
MKVAFNLPEFQDVEFSFTDESGSPLSPLPIEVPMTEDLGSRSPNDGRFSISSVDLGVSSFRSTSRRLSSESVSSWEDDQQRILLNRNEIDERTAEIARTSVRVKDEKKGLEMVNGVRDALNAEMSPQAPTPNGSRSNNVTPLRSEISSLRGVLNTLTDHKQTMANEIMLLQTRSAEYAQALSRAQSQLVEKESHVLYLQSRETVLLLERDALLKEVCGAPLRQIYF